MKDGVIANFEVAEKMLRHFLRLVIDRTFLKVKPTVIAGVPSGITEVERRAVRDSARAGWCQAPVDGGRADGGGDRRGAAGGDAGGEHGDRYRGRDDGDRRDRSPELSATPSIRTGGDELDQAIVQYMRKTYSLLIGEPTAERIKIGIGTAVPLVKEEGDDVKGRDLVSGLPKTVRVDSANIRDTIQEPVSRIVNAVRRALEMTPPELSSDIIDQGDCVDRRRGIDSRARSAARR